MSLHEYEESKRLELGDTPFYALIMAAMRRADDVNLPKLQAAWPEVWDELQARYHAPAGVLEGEPGREAVMERLREGFPGIADKIEKRGGP